MSKWTQGDAIESKELTARVEILDDLIRMVKRDLTERIMALPVTDAEKQRMAVLAVVALVTSMPARTRALFNSTLVWAEEQKEPD